MIQDEANPMIAGQFNVPNTDDRETNGSSPPGDKSLYENTNANNISDEAFLIETIDNEDLLHCSEAASLITCTRSELSAFNQETLFFTSLEDGAETNQISQLPKEIPDRKVFPNLEDHDDGQLQFELNLDSTKLGKNYWYYSKILNKVFIRLDKPFYIDVLYLPKIPEQLFLRIMIVYVDDLGLPVSRCSNHFCKDKTFNDNEKNSIIRCGNQEVSYIGRVDGKNFEDRLALFMRLNFVPPTDNNKDKLSKQSIQLTFVCQNSCTGRKQTAVIFTLETRTQILGKKIVNVKVCSCPKRDKQKDEENFILKRKAEEEELTPHGKRPAKILKIKEEPGTNPTLSIDIQSNQSPIPSLPGCRVTDSGGIFLPLEMPNLRLARKSIQYSFDIIASEMASDPTNLEKYSKYLKDMKKHLDHL